MKTAIIYASKYGTTEKVAVTIAEKLREKNEVELFSLKQKANPDLSSYGIVILGTPIYAGKASKKMMTFFQKNEQALLRKKTGLFVCGMEPSRAKRQKELEDAYPDGLVKNAFASGFLGGAFIFERMNFIERIIINKIAKTNTSVSRIDENAIEAFIKKLLDVL